MPFTPKKDQHEVAIQSAKQQMPEHPNGIAFTFEADIVKFVPESDNWGHPIIQKVGREKVDELLKTLEDAPAYNIIQTFSCWGCCMLFWFYATIICCICCCTAICCGVCIANR